MSLEIQVGKALPINTPKIFRFGQPINKYIVGISDYNLQFGADHYMLTMSISLITNHSGNQLEVTPQVILCDTTGHTADPTNSSITAVAIAWTEPNDDSLQLASANGIPNNGRSNPILLPSSTPQTLQAILSGFNLSFGSVAHPLQNYLCGVGSQSDGSSGYITASALMGDASGNSTTVPTCNAGLIVNCDPTTFTTLELQYTDKLQDNSRSLTFSNTVNTFIPVLTRVQAQFGIYDGAREHQVKYIDANLSITSPSGQNPVTVSGGAHLRNTGNEIQDNNLTFASGVVIGYHS